MIYETSKHISKLSKKLSKSRVPSKIDTDVSKITSKLYDDAIKRRQNMKKQENIKSKSPKRPSYRMTTKASNKVLENRFINDFNKVVKTRKLKQRLNYHNTETVLKDLGFMSASNAINETEQKVLFVDLWGCLHGEIEEKIERTNLKILLGAIQGFNIQIKKEVEDPLAVDLNAYLAPEVPDNSQTNEKIKIDLESSNHSNNQTDRRHNESKDDLHDSSRDTSKFCWFQVGIFNIDGIINLSLKEIKRWQRYFILFARNRSKHIKDQK